MNTTRIDGKLVEVIDYNPRPHQQDLRTRVLDRLRTNKGPQFFVPVWHRRVGKSSGSVNLLFEVATNPEFPVAQYYYFYPKKIKIREHIYDNPNVVPKFLPTSQVKHKDDQIMKITFKTGSQVIFDGADDDPDKHRGGNGRIYIVDEYDDQKKRIFTEIIRPIIEENNGIAILQGTPRGVLQLHDGYEAGQDPTRPEWWSSILPGNASVDSQGNRLFSDEQLARIKRDYETEGIGDMFEQEWMCKFVQGASQVFRKLDQVILDEFGNRIVPKEPEPGRRYQIATDPAITFDYWVNSVIDLHTHHEVYLERFQPKDTDLGEARTEALSRKYNNAPIVIDESGIGKPIADHLEKKKLRLKRVKTGVNKQPLITNLSLIIDALSLRFIDDPVGNAEMREFSFERLPSGGFKFEAPEGKHDDIVIARALHAWELPRKPLPEPKNDPRVWNPYERPDKSKSYVEKNNTYFGANKKRED